MKKNKKQKVILEIKKKHRCTYVGVYVYMYMNAYVYMNICCIVRTCVVILCAYVY